MDPRPRFAGRAAFAFGPVECVPTGSVLGAFDGLKSEELPGAVVGGADSGLVGLRGEVEAERLAGSWVSGIEREQGEPRLVLVATATLRVALDLNESAISIPLPFFAVVDSFLYELSALTFVAWLVFGRSIERYRLPNRRIRSCLMHL